MLGVLPVRRPATRARRRFGFAVTAATAGGVVLIAANVNQALIDSGGIRLAAGLVGLVEESTKLLVPLGLYALGRYRDPRAGIGIGLAAGFGFAIAETTQYAHATASASGPNFCGDEVAAPTAASVLQAQTGCGRASPWRSRGVYGTCTAGKAQWARSP